MIENRNLNVGDRLVVTYKGEIFSAQVVETEKGWRYRLLDGREFKSPSAAGSAVMGGIACNGWRFWSIEGQEPPRAQPPTKAKKAGRLIQRTPNQKGVEDGQVRYFCSPCMKSFVAAEGERPDVCPDGHRAEDPELLAVATA